MAEAPAPAPKPPQQPRSMASGSFDELIHPFMMDSVENFQFNEDGPPQMNVPGYCNGVRRYPHFIHATRLHERRRWVVFFPILRLFLAGSASTASAARASIPTGCSKLR